MEVELGYPCILRVTANRFTPDELFIVNPQGNQGHVATVYSAPEAARLFASSPDLAAALAAILRVKVDPSGDFPSIEEAFEEVQSIARDALVALPDWPLE